MNIIPASPRRRWPAPHQLTLFMFIALASTTSCGVPGDKQTESKIQVGVQTRDTTAEGDEIKRMIGKYAKSIDEANTTLASQIWWDSPDVSFIHPLGHEHGFEQIKQNVYRHLMGDTFSERKLTIHDVSVHVYEDAAWAEFYWDFVAKFRKDGSPVVTHGRETQVYRKAPDGWRLVHVHYSGMPVTEERKGF
jgi:ketosteroid isomerase-like protein